MGAAPPTTRGALPYGILAAKGERHMRHTRLLAAAGTLFVCAAVLSQCSSAAPPPDATPAAAPDPAELTPVASVHELMRDVIDPVSDLIFDAVGTEHTLQRQTEVDCVATYARRVGAGVSKIERNSHNVLEEYCVHREEASA